jgi:hypothetical protein
VSNTRRRNGSVSLVAAAAKTSEHQERKPQMSLSASTDYRPATRTRTRRPAFKVEMPEPTKGRYHVALRRGQTYHLAGADKTFRRGEIHEVSEETYQHLADNAFDITSHIDPDVGRVRRKLRKFAFSPELPEEQEVSYPDLADGA